VLVRETYTKLVTSDGTSIIKKLTSRSLTGQGLQIHTHQHIGYKVHLIWHITKKVKESVICMERTFELYGDVYDFCNEIKNGALEGMCSCIATHFLERLEDKVEQCHMTCTHST
jgi:hypothetical protein